MRKEKCFRGALASVLALGLVMGGAPPTAFAEECVENTAGTNCTDGDGTSGNDATQNPLGGDLGGSPAPEGTSPSGSAELMRDYLKEQIMSNSCAVVAGAQTGSAISSALRWAIGAILTATGNVAVGVPLMLGAVLTLGMHLGLLDLCEGYI